MKELGKWDIGPTEMASTGPHAGKNVRKLTLATDREKIVEYVASEPAESFKLRIGQTIKRMKAEAVKARGGAPHARPR